MRRQRTLLRFAGLLVAGGSAPGCGGHCEDPTTMVIVNIVIPVFFIALVLFYRSTKD